MKEASCEVGKVAEITETITGGVNMEVWFSKPISADHYPSKTEFTEATKEQCAQLLKDHEDGKIKLPPSLLNITRHIVKGEWQ